MERVTSRTYKERSGEWQKKNETGLGIPNESLAQILLTALIQEGS